eukprot:1193109-Rhodomonas_salina.3
MSGTDLQRTVLCLCYAMSGTDRAYARGTALVAMTMAEREGREGGGEGERGGIGVQFVQRGEKTIGDTRSPSVVLRDVRLMCYAMCGTDAFYRATRCAVLTYAIVLRALRLVLRDIASRPGGGGEGGEGRGGGRRRGREEGGSQRSEKGGGGDAQGRCETDVNGARSSHVEMDPVE